MVLASGVGSRDRHWPIFGLGAVSSREPVWDWVSP